MTGDLPLTTGHRGRAAPGSSDLGHVADEEDRPPYDQVVEG
jgi:hypothetical protein